MYITCNNIYIFIIIGKIATPNTITIQATKQFYNFLVTSKKLKYCIDKAKNLWYIIYKNTATPCR